MKLPADDALALAEAMRLLEHPSLGARIANAVGMPVGRLIGWLPAGASATLAQAAHKAVHAALKVSLKTLPAQQASGPPRAAAPGWHKLASAASGAAGGAFGLAALTLELPVSTTIMMRSIADIARSEGADLREPDTQLECVMVLGLGGDARGGDASELGYFAAREALSRAVSGAAAHVARHGLASEGAPALVRLISLIANRYSVNVSEKAAAQLVPLLGALGGATLNTIFIDHFQSVARGHFTVRRLERVHGVDAVRAQVEALRAGRRE